MVANALLGIRYDGHHRLFIFRDMPQTPPMTHKEFRLQAAWGLILAKTESKTRRTQSNSQNPPGQQLERTLCFLPEGSVTVGISLSNLRGSEGYAGSVGRKIGGRENPSFYPNLTGLVQHTISRFA